MAISPQEVSFDYESPVGRLRLTMAESLLLQVKLRPSKKLPTGTPPQEIPAKLTQFLDAYFRGKPMALDRAWLPPPSSSFAKKIYHTLIEVPFGQLITYGELAEKAGFTQKHARAVGQVMNKNPWPLFVPCHRVVASGNRLGGFGAGTKIKIALLHHEGISMAGIEMAKARFATTLQQVSYGD